jgi:hypothetical protein
VPRLHYHGVSAGNMRRSNTHGIAVCNGDCKCHAYGNGNTYWYSFTYTNGNS